MTILLRHLCRSDYQGVRDYVCNPEVAKYLTWEAYSDEEKVKTYFEQSLLKNDFPDEVLGIVYGEKLIGTAHLILRNNEFVQLGYGILPKYWGRGIGTAILEKILVHIGKSAWAGRASEIWADVNRKNARATCIFKGRGFILRCENIEPGRDRFVYKLP